MHRHLRWVTGSLVAVGLMVAATATHVRADDPPSLGTRLAPLWDCLSGGRHAFALAGRIHVGPDGGGHDVELRFERYDVDAYDLLLEHRDYAVVLRRRRDATALALPRHGVVHLGAGPVDDADNLAPVGAAERLVSADSLVAAYAPLLMQPSAAGLVTLAGTLVGIEPDGPDRWRIGDTRIELDTAGTSLGVSSGDVRVAMTLEAAGAPRAWDDWPDLEPSTLPRDEIERTLARGLRRALEILAPGPTLLDPVAEPRAHPHGQLEWIDGHRVVTLYGTPEEIGAAHGELVATEARRCIDSVLYVVGTVETVRGGRWFRHRLEEAKGRLAPHIPERHGREVRALAAALGEEPELLETVNVFPELFHCSGFAVSGSATADGTLYHGRVLDYMTEIGLQDAAATFVVAAEGSIPFVTVGYAGFCGSVSGMNERGISLGEMGGRGEGQWDGVPMATLMRRALEECETLDEVMELWRSSPRTCEYYYVFADGKSRRAVGVAATPERIEFVGPGEGHPLLGEGIPDAVVLSAGDRLETLRARVREGHGRIDETMALRLMDRPVAMKSNLHNVLFVPERLVLHVALAGHGVPAAERPAVRLDLAALLAALPRDALAACRRRPIEPGQTFPAADSLGPAADASPDARDCLAGLLWKPESFAATLEPAIGGHGDMRLRFPSPRPGSGPSNDEVWLEWTMARDADGVPCRAPACVVVHESGSGMTVGRLIARSLAAHGIHAFMINLPYYGQRRPPGTRPGPEALVSAVGQAVADVRRARDAVAALPVVDAGRIAVQGTSLGGFVTATAAGIDKGFDAVFIMLAGGDLAGVLAAGKQDAEKLRQRLEAAGMDETAIRDTLHRIEPLRLAHRFDPDRTWIFSGRFDDVVPPRHADILAAAAGLDESHHLRMYANHYSGIVFLPAVLAHMRTHLLGAEVTVSPASPE